MKKFFKNKIKSILTVSTNRTGISLDKIKENFPFEFHKDKVELLLNEDNDVIKNKEKTNQTTDNFNYSLTNEYIKSNNFEEIEKKIYKLDYLCSLFKEIEIINIYKLIKDSDKITYQQIVNYLINIYNLKKDIKQVSHYCLILLKLKQILSYQPVTVEKFNSSNIIGNSYLTFRKENAITNYKNNKENYIKQNTLTNMKLSTFQIMTKALIFDESQFKEIIMFHLYLNKEKEGISANELYIACDFLKRSKILNKIITYMENESTITHKALRKGKIMEFLYHIIDEKKITTKLKLFGDSYSKYLARHISDNKDLKKASKSCAPNKLNFNFLKNKKEIKKENENKEEKVNEVLNKEEKKDKKECINILEDDENNKDKKITLESEILNKEDYNFILDKIKELGKKVIKESEDKNAMRKNVINYISSIEKNKNVSLSSYNRYIFILNILYEKKVLSFVEIKHHISNELEKNNEFMIDRKTIRRLLNTLEKIGLIKIVRYELTMRNLIHKYLNSKEEIKQEKIIVVHRDVDINNKIFHHQVNEKLRSNKKSESKINVDKKELKKLIEENKKNNNLNNIVNNVIDNNNDMIKINLKEKLFIPIFNILKKIENKKKIDIKKEYNKFMQRLKRNFCSYNYINNLYNEKDKEIDIINKYKNDNFIENFYEKNNFSYFDLIKEESQQYSNIIIPKYILDKYTKNESENMFIEDSQENKNKIISNEFENSFYTIKSKYFMDESNISFLEEIKEKEKEDISKTLIGNKRYRLDKLKDCYLDNKNYNRTVVINDILDIICNIPGITLKTLRKMLNVNSQNFCIEKNIITYMINLGLIYAQDFDQKNFEVIDDTKLYSYSDLDIFI